MATRGVNDGEQSTELPADVVADLLSDGRRRRLLEILDERGTPVVVRELATTLLAAERETTPSDIPDRYVDDCCAELYDEHLPKLTATGVVEYDSMVETVELKRPAILDS